MAQERKGQKVKQARLKARLTPNQLAGLALVSRGTVMKAEEGTPIQEVKAYSIVEALNARLPDPNDHISMDDIETL